MMSVSGVTGSSSENLMTTNSAKTTAETEMNPLREIASVMMVSNVAGFTQCCQVYTMLTTELRCLPVNPDLRKR